MHGKYIDSIQCIYKEVGNSASPKAPSISSTAIAVSLLGNAPSPSSTTTTISLLGNNASPIPEFEQIPVIVMETQQNVIISPVKYLFTYSSNYGGNGGSDFNMLNDVYKYVCNAMHENIDIDQLGNYVKLRQVLVSAGKYVDSIRCVYEFINSRSTTTTFETSLYGGGGGKLYTCNCINDSIINCTIRSGRTVDGIVFYTLNNEIIHCGGMGGQSYNIPCSGQLFAFKGKAGKFIDQLQLIFINESQ